MNETMLFKALRELYPRQEYALLPQVANATGYAARRHADAVALSLWPSRGLHLHGFEMKCDRRDWKRELEDPAKAEEIASRCHYWSIVTSGPKVVLKEDELPKPWGLLEWDENKSKLVKKKAAEFRADVVEPTWAFVAALLRKAQDVTGLTEEIEQAKKEGLELGRRHAKYDLESFENLKDRVAEFSKASGIDLYSSNRFSHEDPKKLGAAVRHVLDGKGEKWREELLRMAELIKKELG